MVRKRQKVIPERHRNANPTPTTSRDASQSAVAEEPPGERPVWKYLCPPHPKHHGLEHQRTLAPHLRTAVKSRSSPPSSTSTPQHKRPPTQYFKERCKTESRIPLIHSSGMNQSTWS
ncbi:hypothetical protein TNCV_191281 [Trichonephila clavipes]|nr:hypothetical protein TNCV_191281 [Trichonephila clavipes]